MSLISLCTKEATDPDLSNPLTSGKSARKTKGAGMEEEPSNHQEGTRNTEEGIGCKSMGCKEGTIAASAKEISGRFAA